jgi:hypothetical protein
LVRLVREADLSRLPEIRGWLARADTEALIRLRMDGSPVSEPGRHQNAGTPRVAEKWITPQQAAEIAKVPKKRIYSWARGQKWASRPTRRCLRINEALFRAWLASRI